MPQFDVTTFSSQIFWVVVIFTLLYFIMARFALPRVAEVMEERQDKIDDDLAKAERLKNEAETVLAEYEKAIADARSEAGEVMQAASDAIAADDTKRQAELSRALSKRTEEAEARIAEAQRAALDNIRSVAAEAAGSATAKLIDEPVSGAEAQAAVEQVAGPTRHAGAA